MKPQQLKKIRESFDMSQADWAEFTGCNKRTIQNVEQGRTKASDAYCSLLRLLVMVSEHSPLLIIAMRMQRQETNLKDNTIIA